VLRKAANDCVRDSVLQQQQQQQQPSSFRQSIAILQHSVLSQH